MIRPDRPSDSAGPVFSEPWEARAFAMTLQLHERGLFTWPEWAAALAEQIAATNAPAGAERSYYEHWLLALESLVERSGMGSLQELKSYTRAWQYAARRTPHGQPIELSAEDLFHGA